MAKQSETAFDGREFDREVFVANGCIVRIHADVAAGVGDQESVEHIHDQ
jgi:hypothetical protein